MGKHDINIMDVLQDNNNSLLFLVETISQLNSFELSASASAGFINILYDIQQSNDCQLQALTSHNSIKAG